MAEAIWTTLRLAGLTTVLLLIVATPLALWLARGGGWLREGVAAVTALPLVLPPTVLGFYLLLLMAPGSPAMVLLRPFGVNTLAFTFAGLVIGSMIYSLPFAVQPIRNAFEAMGDEPWEAAATLRASPLDTLFAVALPLARRGLVSAALLVFAHTVGEFGVVLMIGGAIPGRTDVVSTHMFQLVESSNTAQAGGLAAGLVGFSFLALAAVMVLDRRLGRVAG
jgi:molybdate transport system permease protein